MYFQEAIVGSEVMLFMIRNLGDRSQIYQALKSESDASEAKSALLEKAKDYYKDYNATIDKNILAAALNLYYNDVPKEFHPPLLTSLHKKSKGDFTNFANKYFKKTPFSSYEKFEDWVNNSLSLKSLEKDLVYQLQKDFLAVYRSKVMMPKMVFDSDYNKGMRLFVDGLQKMGNE